ncbi:ParB/RepB/Spo0J family partition protein [Rhodospirillum sp. A1_3_36]|uniref:ParB/RepB/Spo0J family partition protein n=1 Tax=Rhodospirillum sp. A1_3_36 TaxID=3391666 RepID=UPI0039A6CF93
MARSPKITLSRARDIPFDKLVPSERNVRRVRAGVSIETLAEDIARRTLLQGLSVRPIPDREDFFEVQAGGRRYRALEMLVKQRRLTKTAPIPCIVREEGLVEEDSLAENTQRVALHPLDQFRAFQALVDLGLGEEEVAARFFVTSTVVRQRLKLASVSPKLLDLYAEDQMSLEQLMAFTLVDDHARQEEAWETVQGGYNREPYTLRRLLTGNAIRASDKRARFIGLDAYEAAGGVVLRDLFDQQEDGWFQDPVLLERLVSDKLAAEAEVLKAEGWTWVRAVPDLPYGFAAGHRRLTGEVKPLFPETLARRDALRVERDEIEARYAESGESLPDDIDRRIGEIQEEFESIEDQPVLYAPEDIARAGVFLGIDSEGGLRIERGYVRPEDEETSEPKARGEGEAASSNGEAETSMNEIPPMDEPEEEGIKPLSERLIMELTAHRTLALRDALAEDPDMALIAVLHAMVHQAFYRYATESCLEIAWKSTGFSVQGSGLSGSPSVRAIEARHPNWERQLPPEPDMLWEFLCGIDHDSRMGLFAHCAALTVNAVHEPWNKATGRRRHADQLACALSLDMTATGWRPTVDSYLGRVPKARILEAVTEAKGEASAQLIDHLKKTDMAEQAERLLADSGWLPEPLRTPGLQPEATGEPEGDARPAFLTDAAE